MNKVTYKLKMYGKVGVGRRYPTPFKETYQTMKSRLRRLVMDGKTISLDIVNAHPSLLKQLIYKNSPGFELPHLKRYVEESERTVCMTSWRRTA